MEEIGIRSAAVGVIGIMVTVKSLIDVGMIFGLIELVRVELQSCGARSIKRLFNSFNKQNFCLPLICLLYLPSQ